MKNNSLKIIFMGTPSFSVPTLDALHKSEHEVVAAITATDKWGGRGKKQLLESAVKKYAVDNDIPVLQPKNLKAQEFIAEVKSFQADIQVVVAFRMLPVVIWDMPALGTINLHASLLPDYRGAAPINWAIINGEKETGLTTFRLKHEIDTGDLIDQLKVPIDNNDNAGTLHDKLMIEGAQLMLKTINQIANNQAQFHQQDLSGNYPKAPKLHSKNLSIDWSKDAESIYNFIRGLSPYPAAWTKVDDQRLKIFLAKPLTSANLDCGEIQIEDNRCFVGTRTNDIELLEVQLAGKRRMSVEEWLRGNQPKDRFFSNK